jgi:hypothetical protein
VSLAVVAVVIASCTSERRSNPASSSSPPAPPFELAPAAPGAPILEMDAGAGNAGGLAPRLNSFELAVYEDGHSIVGDFHGYTWQMTEGLLTGAELQRVHSLASQVLSSAAIHFHPGVAVADASGERLIGWSGRDIRVTGIANRSDDELFAGSPDAGRRDAWNELVALVTGAVTARGHSYLPFAMALFTEPTSGNDSELLDWPGPDLTAFGSSIGSPTLQMPSGAPIQGPVLIPADVRCGIVDDIVTSAPRIVTDTPPPTFAEAVDAPDLLFKIGQQRSSFWRNGETTFEVVIRPLLPHEATCDDAFAI